MADLIRLSVKGAMPSGEEWSVNPVFSLASAGSTVSPADIAAIAAGCAAVAVPAGLLSAMIAATTVSGIRAEARTAAGVLQSQAESILATPRNGTGTSPMPFQSAWVVSLRTAAVGGSGRGRLYWPATGLGISSLTLRPTSGVVVTFLSAAQVYLTNLRNAINVVKPGTQLAVWSRLHSSLAQVTSLQVGDVIDTQRRRRDTLVETVQSTLFV